MYLPSRGLRVFLMPLLILWLVRCLAETNRTPFDFAEGESELVSGFNVEFGRVFFVLIFIREYGMILFFSILTRGLFLTGVTLRVRRFF